MLPSFINFSLKIFISCTFTFYTRTKLTHSYKLNSHKLAQHMQVSCSEEKISFLLFRRKCLMGFFIILHPPSLQTCFLSLSLKFLDAIHLRVEFFILPAVRWNRMEKFYRPKLAKIYSFFLLCKRVLTVWMIPRIRLILEQTHIDTCCYFNLKAFYFTSLPLSPPLSCCCHFN